MATRPKRKAELQRELRHLQDELDAARRELHEIKDTIRNDCDDEVVIAPRQDYVGKMDVQLPQQDSFDGSRPWSSFVASFTNLAAACGWDDHEKRFRLLACLRGDAADYAYQQLPDEVVNDYGKLTDALADRFAARRTPATFIAQLESRRLAQRESLVDYAADIKKLTTFGYPTADAATLESIATRHFLRGLGDQQMTMTIGMQEPRTLQEARDITERYLSLKDETVRKPIRSITTSNSTSASDAITEDRFLTFEKRVMETIERRLNGLVDNGVSGYDRNGGPKYNRDRTGNGRCFECHKEGHFARQCPIRLQRYQRQAQQPRQDYQQWFPPANTFEQWQQPQQQQSWQHHWQPSQQQWHPQPPPPPPPQPSQQRNAPPSDSQDQPTSDRGSQSGN